MKNLLVIGFFSLILVFTYFVVKSTMVLKIGEKNVAIVTKSHEHSDAEVIEKGFNFDGEKRFFTDYQTIETRTRKGFGWETKIDTVNKRSYSRTN